MITKPKEGKK